MLRDLMWAMHEGDRDGGGTLSKHELRGVLSKYRLHMRQAGGIVSIAQKYSEKDGEISDENLRKVMIEITSVPEDFITVHDILRVRKLGGTQKEVVQNMNLMDKSGPSSTLQINVDHLARAIDRVRFYLLVFTAHSVVPLLQAMPLTEPARPRALSVGRGKRCGDRADESAQVGGRRRRRRRRRRLDDTSAGRWRQQRRRKLDFY